MSVFTININPKVNLPPTIDVWSVNSDPIVVDEGSDVSIDLAVVVSDRDSLITQTTTQYQFPDTNIWIDIETTTAQTFNGTHDILDIRSSATGIWKFRSIVTDGVSTVASPAVEIAITVIVDSTIPDFDENDFDNTDFLT